MILHAWSTRLAVCLLTLSLGACATRLTPGSPEETARRRDDAAKLAEQGTRAQEAGNLDEAITLYGQSINTYGELPGVRTNLAVALMSKGDYLRAASVLKDEIEISPRDPRPLINLGLLYRDRGWLENAYDYLDRALVVDQANITALRAFSDVSRRLRREDERAIEHVKMALLVETDPKWLDEFRWQKIRIEKALKDAKTDAKPESKGDAKPAAKIETKPEPKAEPASK